MEKKEKVVVVFDSGVGGLTVLSELKKQNIKEKFIYLADSANAPYGDKTKEQIIINVLNCFKHLSHLYDFKAIVIACNTASIYTKDLLSHLYSVPVYSVVDAATDFIQKRFIFETIDVLATALTAKSHAYKNNLPKQYIREIGCPTFVPFIESDNYFISEKREKVVSEQLTGLATEGAKFVVLGCTHYPLIEQEIHSFYGSQCTIINPSELLALKVSEVFSLRDTLFDSTYYTTSTSLHFDFFASKLMNENVTSHLLEEVLDEYVLNSVKSSIIQ